ncbi:MAG: sortase [Lachnospirales bacterium]
MPKKMGIVFVIVGTVLILSALSFFLYNRYEDAQAGREAENMLSDVQNIIREKETPTISEETMPSETIAPELPITEIEGYGYVGYLSIPDLELELPVMSEWDYNRLEIAPCRQFGSSRTDDLVIAAHNYKNHFGRLSQLEVGDTVFFTDMDGIENIYEVVAMDTLAPTEVEAVQNSGHDLVLYTCTYGGRTRVTVFCDRPEESMTVLTDNVQ